LYRAFHRPSCRIAYGFSISLGVRASFLNPMDGVIGVRSQSFLFLPTSRIGGVLQPERVTAVPITLSSASNRTIKGPQLTTASACIEPDSACMHARVVGPRSRSGGDKQSE